MKKHAIVFLVVFTVCSAFLSCGNRHKGSVDSLDTMSMGDSIPIDTMDESGTENTEEDSPTHLASLQPSDVILPSELDGCVEIVNGEEDCIPIDINDDGYPSISITFKLLRSVDTSSLSSEYGQLWIVGFPQDASGRDVRSIIPNYNEWRSEDSDGKIFKGFLEGDPESTITLTFTGESNVKLFEEDEAKKEAGHKKTEANKF